MALTDHVNDDTEMLHHVLSQRLGLDPGEARQATLEVLDMLGGRSLYLPSGAKTRRALAKEKARALLDQELGPVDVQRRVAENDDVGTLSLQAIKDLRQDVPPDAAQTSAS
jgi:hypothetical protein